MSPAERSEYIRQLVDAAPPLSAAQRIRLAVLLRPEPTKAKKPNRRQHSDRSAA